MRGSWKIAAVLGVVCAPATASAHWYATRGDATRTGTVTGSGAWTPSVSAKWKRYLGGNAIPGSFVVGPKGDVVYLARADHLRATKPNDSAVWETPLVGVREVLGVVDLDGNGKLEIVGVSSYSGRVMAFDAISGNMVWATDLDRFRKYGIGAVRLRDVTGDGLPEIYVASRGSGSLVSDIYADVYTFAGGVANAQTLFTVDLSTHDYDIGLNDAWADLDGDGQEELVQQGREAVYAYDASGAPFAQGGVGWVPYGKASSLVVDVDGDGDDEVVLFSNAPYPAAQNSRRVAVVDLQGAGTLGLRWEQGVTDLENDRHFFTAEAVADLDGDGTLELVSSFYTGATDTYTTHVWSADQGIELASFPGLVTGVADADGDGLPEVFTSPGEGQLGVSAWSVGAGGPVLLWTLADRSLAKDQDPTARTRQSALDRTVRMDVDGDGVQELVLLQSHADGTWSLDAYDASSGSPVQKATYALPASVTVGTLQLVPTPQGDTLFVARSDGFLAMLRGALVPVNEVTYPNGGKIPGIRTGGYFTGWRGVTSPLLTGNLWGDARDEVIVRDSRGALLALDPTLADISVSPTVVWEQLGETFTPALLDADGDGHLEVATGRVDTLTLRSGTNGGVIWSQGIAQADTGFFLGTDMDGDGISEIGVSTRSNSQSMQRYTVLSSGGATLMPPVERNGNVGTGLFSFADFTGDGVADMVAHPGNNLIAVDGASGAVLHESDAGNLSMIPILADVDADGAPEVLGNGFGAWYVQFHAIPSGLSYIGYADNTEGELAFYQYGALIQCPSGPRQIYAMQNSPRVRVVDAATRTNLFDAFLAAGAVHPTPDAALDATTAPPFVGNINAVTDLAGDGEPRLLAGSTDGNLYVLHGCAATPDSFLDFAVDFGVPVSEAIPGNVDEDPQMEVLVSTLDGELRALDMDWLASPLVIQEAQGDAGDADELETVDAVPLRWNAVQGATRYEVGIFDALGSPVVPFHDVGSATSSVEHADLLLDAPYFSYVRAIGADAVPSFPQPSDGFRRVDLSPPDVAFGPVDANVNVHFSDKSGLASGAIQLHDASGVQLRSVNVPLAGGEADAELTLAGLRPGWYTATASATDAAGRTQVEELTFEFKGDFGEPFTPPAPGAGCACSVESTGTARHPWAMAFLALAALLRRTRRPGAR